MLAYGMEPVTVDPAVIKNPAAAFGALADAARVYLRRLDDAVAAGDLPARCALLTRVRGTGPGVAFGDVINVLQQVPVRWECPFEQSHNVSGAVLRGADVDAARDDAFLFLRFAPGTRDLPLHVHADSDRFILAIGGRGFFHVSPDAIRLGPGRRIQHVPFRDRDALVFRRGTVHTFSTDAHELLLLSYHHPYVALEDPTQYTLTDPPEHPSEFLQGCASRVSFDPGWSILGAAATG